MSTFALDIAGDLDLSSGNLRLVTGGEEASVRLRGRLGVWLGEWWKDTRIGVPYLAGVFVKRPNLGLIRSIFVNVIETTPGIVQGASVTASLNARTRELGSTFTATADDGSTITGGLGETFIVQAKASP